jgi:integrase
MPYTVQQLNIIHRKTQGQGVSKSSSSKAKASGIKPYVKHHLSSEKDLSKYDEAARQSMYVGHTAASYGSIIKYFIKHDLLPGHELDANGTLQPKRRKEMDCSTWVGAIKIAILQRVNHLSDGYFNQILCAVAAYQTINELPVLTEAERKYLHRWHTGVTNARAQNEIPTAAGQDVTKPHISEGAIHQSRFDAMLKYFSKMGWETAKTWARVIFICAFRPCEAELATFADFDIVDGHPGVTVLDKKPGEAHKRQVGEGDVERRRITQTEYNTIMGMPHDSLFDNVLGGFRRETLNRCIQQAAAALEWPDDFIWNTYSLRHGRAVTIRMKLGKDQVHLYTGHSTAAMIDHYSSYDDERRAKAKGKRLTKSARIAAASKKK